MESGRFVEWVHIALKDWLLHNIIMEWSWARWQFM